MAGRSHYGMAEPHNTFLVANEQGDEALAARRARCAVVDSQRPLDDIIARGSLHGVMKGLTRREVLLS